MNTVIFRRDLSFVYGLTYSSQKPERQKSIPTLFKSLNAGRPITIGHGVRNASGVSEQTRKKKRRADTGETETARKTAGRYREESLPRKAGPSSLRIRRETQALV
ncbi:hypothetical protein [Marinobacter sediminicola]|uniref:hypothetical protein n=1 Tax=Marinobacter sediminicola TaxID=3072994 RepID=UPI002622F672|nr:hypothetical protein [Marinobacter sp. F26243]